jgi:competence protein ComFC
MDEKARRESVEKSFAVKNKRLIESEKLLLVDDVFTTGATVSTCAQILKENGAGEVFVLTIARAV